MTPAAEEIRITRTLSLDDVHWPSVLELLSKRYKLSFREANAIVDGFFSRILKPLHIGWFLQRELRSDDNRLLSAVCECHGADSVVLTHERPYRAGPLLFLYSQSVEFTPALRQSADKSGICDPVMQLRLFGRSHRIRCLRDVLFAYAVLGLFGIVSYVLVVGALLYSFSVFLLFLEHPVGVTEAATDNLAIGLALLCFLAGCAAIFGRAISNVTRLLIQKIRTPRLP